MDLCGADASEAGETTSADRTAAKHRCKKVLGPRAASLATNRKSRRVADFPVVVSLVCRPLASSERMSSRGARGIHRALPRRAATKFGPG